MEINCVASFFSHLVQHPISHAVKTICGSALRELYCFLKASISNILDKTRSLIRKIDYIGGKNNLTGEAYPLEFRIPQNFDLEYESHIVELRTLGMSHASEIFKQYFDKFKKYFSNKTFVEEFNEFYVDWQKMISSIGSWSYISIMCRFFQSTLIGMTYLLKSR